MSSPPVPFGVAKKTDSGKGTGFYKEGWKRKKTIILYCDICYCPLQSGICVGCNRYPYSCKKDECGCVHPELVNGL